MTGRLLLIHVLSLVAGMLLLAAWAEMSGPSTLQWLVLFAMFELPMLALFIISGWDVATHSESESSADSPD